MTFSSTFNLCSKSKNVEAKKDAILKDATANALFWESKLESSERIKKEYRDNAKKLLVENETLQTKLTQAEKDTVQVISFLKDEDIKKQEQVIPLKLIYCSFSYCR
jgi:hypothetical protein